MTQQFWPWPQLKDALLDAISFDAVNQKEGHGIAMKKTNSWMDLKYGIEKFDVFSVLNRPLFGVTKQICHNHQQI